MTRFGATINQIRPAHRSGTTPFTSVDSQISQVAMRSPTIAYTAPAIAPLERHDSTDLRGLIATLRRHSGRILLATLAGLTLAVAYLMMATPRYTASTSLFIDPRYRKVVNEEVVQGGMGGDLALVETQVSILTSDTILRRVVEAEKLASDLEFAPKAGAGPLSQLRELVMGPRPERDPVDLAMVSLSKAMRVKRAQKTYVVDVEVTSTSPTKAARLAQRIAEAYLADQSASKAAEVGRASKLLQGRLGELTEQVRQAEARVDAFRRSNNILTAEGGLLNEQQLTRLNGELIAARSAMSETKARADEATRLLRSGAGPDSMGDAVRSNLIQRLREQYATVARREASLGSQLQARHPMMVEVRSQMSEIRAQIQAELRRIGAAADSEYKIAQAREAEIARALEGSKTAATRTHTAQIRLRELERELDSSRELLRTFMARAKETAAQQSLTVPDARVITPASVPTSPSRPIGWMALALGLIGGLGLGIVRALVSDHLDTSLRTSEEIAGDTGTRTIASIPTLAGSAILTRLSRRLSGAGQHRASYGDVMAALAPGAANDALPFRQSILRLLRRLRMHARTGHPQRILLTSGHRDSGTSATALALAYASASSGERTLLVDAASTDADLSGVFATGLAQRRTCVLDSKEHLAELVTQDSRTGLAFLPIALADLRLLKPIDRMRFSRGLDKLSRDYDVVIIDGGAVLEDETVLGLATAADHVLVVARAGTTQRGALAEALDALEAVKERVLGIVMTMASPSGPG